MEQIIEQYIKEDFRYYKGVFSFSCPSLDVEVATGETCNGYFELVSNTVAPEEIILKATHEWMKVEVQDSYESRVRIHYTIDAEYILPNRITTGEILVLTNMGEYALPYVIQKKRECIVVQDKVIATLSQFVEFAKENWKEAVSIFYDREGQVFFTELGSEEKLMYSLFSKVSGHGGNVDEFLVSLKMKEELQYYVVENPDILNIQMASMAQKVVIVKEGYGDVGVYVSSTVDFIKVNRNCLTEENFLSNECELQYTIDLARLQKGLNYGEILLETNYHTIKIPVTVRVPLDQVIVERWKSKKYQMITLMKFYLDFRMKKMEQKDWFEESMELTEELMDENPQDFLIQLFQVQLLLVNGRKNEATRLLNALKTQLESGNISREIYSYYMYLFIVIEEKEEFVLDATAKVAVLYEEYPTFWLAWLLCYMREEYHNDIHNKLELLRKHGAEGCSSPLLYLEVLQIYNHDPILLESLDQFTLETIYFGIKHQWIEHNLLQRVQVLAVEVTEYSKLIMFILSYCYEKEYNVEVLHAICRILIQANLVGEEHYKWYRLAIEQQVRVTNIYEHYMSSMPVEHWNHIVQPALLYFAYGNQLPYEQKTLLYLYVLEHKDELEEIREAYEMQMKEFVIEQIQLSKINEKLAKLYSLVVTTDMLTIELAQSLVNLIFQEEIVVSNRRFKNVVVVHEHMTGEVLYPIINGQTLITVYHPRAKILLEDQYQNRIMGTHLMKRESLLQPIDWYQMVVRYAIISSKLDWYLANEVTDCSKITIKNMLSIARLIENTQISSDWKRNARKYLAIFYYEHDMIEELDRMIEQLKSDETDYEERRVFLQYMIKRGFYDQAYTILCNYGSEAHEVKLLVRLCKRLLGVRQIEYDPVILDVALYAYKNEEYDRVLLSYLVKYYVGDFHTMKQLYVTCMQQGMEVNILAKQIILRILFCKWNESDDTIIYNEFVKLEEDKSYVLAYLKYEALLVLGNEKIATPVIVEDWIQWHHKHGMSRMIALGIIKYFSDKPKQLKQMEQELVIELLQYLIEQAIYFPFFKEFEHLYEPISNFSDDTMIVYQSTMSDKVALYYKEIEEDSDKKPYKKIDLKPIFGQFYVQNFLLFLGEGMEYYIVEDAYGKEVVTKKDTIALANSNDVDVTEEIKSRYHMLNKMQMFLANDEWDLLEKEVENYLKREYITGKLFDVL